MHAPSAKRNEKKQTLAALIGALSLGASAAAFSGCGEVDPLDYISIPVPSFTLNVNVSLSNLPSGWTLPSSFPSTLPSGFPTTLPAGFPSSLASNFGNPPPPAMSQHSVSLTPPASFQQCSLCHGATGQGGVGPELLHEVPEFAGWIVRNGRGGMAKYSLSSLPDSQLNEILAYLASSPRASTGEGLYKDLCSNCHGTDAKGKLGSGPAIKGRGADALTAARKGSGGTNYGAVDYMPKWDTNALSDPELQSIAAYLTQ